MRIVELTARQVRIPLRKPFRHASYTRTSTDNVLVCCTLEDGTVGHGEGVPRAYVTGETIDSALDLLRRSDLPAQLEPCRDFPAAVALAERLRLAPIPGDERACQGNAARCAVELAVLDAYGKHFGEPLSRAAELLAPELYAPRPWVRYSGAITTGKRLKLGFSAWMMRVYRFRQVKVKVGIEGHDDVYRLKVIRPRLGRKIDVRVDANEAWAPADVVRRIEELKPFAVSAFEQPVPHADAACLKEARRATGAAIMLDESLCSAVDAQRAVEQQTCDLFNLRLSKCGGFTPTLRLAQFAKRHGLGCQLGCQVGETVLLSAAGRHFAASVADLRYVEGSYDRHLVRAALGTRDLTFGWGGWAPALLGPGLGVELDPQALERVTVSCHQLL
ncbi:MAG: dipeptide epimerase [Gemmataceae bacterium]|nr:dipeptide epimerase [Gemmataceae bacterium]